MKTMTKFGAARQGATSIEYAVIACLISIVIIGGARSIGTNLATRYFAPVSANLT